MIYEYEKTQLENGFYIVEIKELVDNLFGKTNRTVAEHVDGMWYQTGVDYDSWAYVNPQPTIEVIAKIELDTPTEIRMM